MSDDINITYRYMPDDWDEKSFQSLGGMTAVFLNYNKARTIREAVESVLAQDYPLVECFFMDDASRDGSGSVMEEICRNYRGRFKLTVILNKANKGICGQWNTVSKLATGTWFGMFCADDFSYPDRISVAKTIIDKYPTLRGFCTNGDKCDGGGVTGEAIDETDVFLTSGNRLIDGPIIGATAFWHKSLFCKELPSVPLDDVLLRWVLQMENSENKDSVWLYDGELKTIKYGLGEGVTTSISRDKVLVMQTDKWVDSRMMAVRFAKLYERTYPNIYMHLKNHYQQCVAVKKQLKIHMLQNDVTRFSTVRRLLLLPRIVFSGSYKLCGVYFRRTILEFFGLRVASWVSCNIIHR